MKKKTLVSILLVIVLIFTSALLLVSCSAKSESLGSDYNGSADYDSGYSESDKEDSAGIGTIPSGSGEAPGSKVIKTANATVATKEYEKFLSDISEKIKAYGGYTDAETYSNSAPYRKASITVRIPAEHFDSFRGDLNTLGTLTYFSATKDDVSVSYEVLKSKIETLTLEVGVVEELFAIAKTEGDLNKIAELESRLTDIKLELAEAKARLTAIDNSVAFSTVYLTVTEQEEIVIPEPEAPKGAFARIGENLVNNLKSIGNFFVEFFVFFVSALPYIILIGGIVTGVTFLIIFIDRKNKNKKG